MAHIRRQDTFDGTDYVSCRVGGQWYECEDVNYPAFIGCCSSNPCSGQMCPEGDLYPMSFGSVTSPTVGYPNHSCPYGGLWYTCANNQITFQGCCESNPCNGDGCPMSDLRAAAVHTVVVAGGSTFTVPSSVATTSSIQTTSSASGFTSAAPTTTTLSPIRQTSASASPQSESSSVDIAAIAGGAAAAAVLLTLVLGLALYCLIRRRRIQQSTQESVQHGSIPPDLRLFHKGALGAAMTPLPRYSRRIQSLTYSQAPFSPAPTYQSTQVLHTPHTEPQEVSGLGLSEAEFDRRSKSRSPANHIGSGPVELPAQRLPINRPDDEANKPLLNSILRLEQKPETQGQSGWRG